MSAIPFVARNGLAVGSSFNPYVIADASGNITALTLAAGSSTITGTLTVNGTGTISATTISATTFNGALSGNATTATTLQTAITINGVSFNGSANITVTANTPNSLTFNYYGVGSPSGTTFNGSSAVTISYNSVGAPSVIGTNASGTWGISISGNAATSTSATSATTATNQSGGTVNATTGAFSNAVTITAPSTGSGLTINAASSTPWLITLSRTDLGFSSSVYINTATGWYFQHRPSYAGNISLDAGNYNSYSPTLTGGGASGTWSINVSGNAATATTATNALSLGGVAAANYEQITATTGSAIVPAGTTAQRDATPATGYSRFNTTLSQFEYWNGSAWVASLDTTVGDARYAAIANGVPPGTILPFAGATPPSGYLSVPTAATNISRTTYAALFAAIGTTWGAGDGSTTFGLPYVGADGTLLQSNANLGTTTIGEVISHNHAPLNGNNFFTDYGGALASGGGGGAADALTTANTGGAQNTAAGSRVNFIIKY